MKKGKEKTHNVKQGDAEGRSIGHRGTASGMGIPSQKSPPENYSPLYIAYVQQRHQDIAARAAGRKSICPTTHRQKREQEKKEKVR